MSQQYAVREAEQQQEQEESDYIVFGPRTNRWRRKFKIGPYFSEQA